MPPAPTDPAAPSRRNNIGTLRLIGALVVLLGHAFVLSSADGRTRDEVSEAIADVAAFNLGLPGIGVAMFFAISGFLVAQSYQRRGNAPAYVEARLLRIYPALWLADRADDRGRGRRLDVLTGRLPFERAHHHLRGRGRQPAGPQVRTARRVRQQPERLGERVAVDTAGGDQDVRLRGGRRDRRPPGAPAAVQRGRGRSRGGGPRLAGRIPAAREHRSPGDRDLLRRRHGALREPRRDPAAGGRRGGTRRRRGGLELDSGLPAPLRRRLLLRGAAGWASRSGPDCRTSRSGATSPTAPTSSPSRLRSSGFPRSGRARRGRSRR